MSGNNNGIGINVLIIVGIIVGALLLALGIMLIVRVIIKNKKQNKEVESPSVSDDKWVNALGGKDNIISLEAKGSRLIVRLNKKDLLNKDELHDLGVLSVISSQDKETLVLNEKAENIVNLLK